MIRFNGLSVDGSARSNFTKSNLFDLFLHPSGNKNFSLARFRSKDMKNRVLFYCLASPTGTKIVIFLTRSLYNGVVGSEQDCRGCKTIKLQAKNIMKQCKFVPDSG